MGSRGTKLIAFMNAFSQGKSGGDIVFIEVGKRMRNYNKVIVTSLLGKKLCQKSGLGGEYLITTRESEFRNVIPTYIKRVVKAFFLKIKVEKKNVLLGTSDFLPDVLPIFWLKIRDKKTRWVQHIFHLIPSSRKIPYLAQRLSFFLIKQRADLIVVDNSLLKKDLVRLGFASSKIVVNYPGIDLEYLRSVKGKPRGRYDGIFMAQLRSSKGIFDLIKIWKLVCKEKPEARLGIIGKGEKEIVRKLKREIKIAGLEENIDLLGYLEDNRAFGAIKASKIFVFPSYEEGFGIAPLEAQALGLPVVAWNLPVFAEVFPEGMVKVRIGDVEKFAREVLSLLTDPPLYNHLSGEAVANASRFDWDKVAKKEIELFNSIKARPCKSPYNQEITK